MSKSEVSSPSLIHAVPPIQSRTSRFCTSRIGWSTILQKCLTHGRTAPNEKRSWTHLSLGRAAKESARHLVNASLTRLD